jgi:predicted HicB family RNase H-like nuclease
MGSTSYKGYVAQVEFDAAAAALIGRVVNSREPLEFRADAASDALAQFRAVIDGYLADCEARGAAPAKPYSGRILLRIDPQLHAAVAADASANGESINGWIESAVRERLER